MRREHRSGEAGRLTIYSALVLLSGPHWRAKADPINSDGGVLPLAGADRQVGLIDTPAAIIPDHRDPAQTTHTMSR
jgi:hypothetical protein